MSKLLEHNWHDVLQAWSFTASTCPLCQWTITYDPSHEVWDVEAWLEDHGETEHGLDPAAYLKAMQDRRLGSHDPQPSEDSQ